ncbi:hypothetical protein B0I74DRAFT_164647 [Yarrowia lipolytica]|nr:hypothetical protein B0I74DRAFT_164647 [Yarrowia lipolytica]
MSGWKSCWKYFETWLDSACRRPEEISTVSHSQERLAVLHEAFRQLEDRSAVFDPEFDADLVADVEAQGEAKHRRIELDDQDSDEGPHTGSGLGSDILEDHHTCSLVVEDLAAPEIALTLGVERIFTQIYEEGRTMLKMFLENLVEDTVTYAEQAKRKTVTPLDVVYALKRQATGSSSLGLRLELSQ